MVATKQTTIPIHTIAIQGMELQCLLDKDKKPYVNYSNHSQHSLADLVKAIPTLEQQENLKTLAYLINFFTKGLEYQFISNIKSYQEQYLNRIEFEQNSFDYIPRRIIDHGVFDVTVMQNPRLTKDELIFYVKEDHTGIPYCVHCPFPIKSEQQIRYQLLPYAS